MKQVLGPGRRGTALWGALCPSCGADLKVPNSRVLLILSSAVFFGSQSSLLFKLKTMTQVEVFLGQLFLILGFYVIAIFIFISFERVHQEPTDDL